MSTGPVPPAPAPKPALSVNLGQIAPTLVALVVVWAAYQGFQYLRAHVRWVVEPAVPVKPVDPPKPPAPRPFPSTWMFGGRITHA